MIIFDKQVLIMGEVRMEGQKAWGGGKGGRTWGRDGLQEIFQRSNRAQGGVGEKRDLYYLVF